MQEPAAQSASSSPIVIPWWRVGIQLYLLISVSTHLRSVLFFMLGTVFMCYRLAVRKFGWVSYLAVMGALALIELWFKGF